MQHRLPPIAARLQQQLDALETQPGFATARDALRRAAASDGNPQLSYQEYRSATLPEGWRPRLAQMEAALVADFHEGEFGSLAGMLFGNHLGSVNRVLEAEGLPRVGLAFAKASLAANPRR